jgi:surface polysaccharide O-acyltransferase-like enzyme
MSEASPAVSPISGTRQQSLTLSTLTAMEGQRDAGAVASLQIPQGRHSRQTPAHGRAEYVQHKQARSASLDYLRILSMVGVVCIHVSSGPYISSFKFGHDNNLKLLFWLAFRQPGYSAVPIFFCLSGILFISKKELPIKTLWKKYVSRLALIYIVWFVISRAFQLWNDGVVLSTLLNNPLSFFKTGQPYHLWFFPYLIMAYILLPVLRQIALNWKVLEYFCAVFVLASIVTSFVSLVGITFGIKTVSVLAAAFPFTSFLLNSCGLLLLGYYIWNKNFPKAIRKLIYASGVLGLVLVIGISYYSSIKHGAVTKWTLGNYTIFTLSIVVALITLFKHKFAGMNTGKVGTFLSSCTLGVYVIHGVVGMIILSLVQKNLPHGLFVGKMTIITLPLSVLFVICVSLIITLILQRIPIIRKVV